MLFMLQSDLVNFISALLEKVIEYSALFYHDTVLLYNLITCQMVQHVWVWSAQSCILLAMLDFSAGKLYVEGAWCKYLKDSWSDQKQCNVK